MILEAHHRPESQETGVMVAATKGLESLLPIMDVLQVTEMATLAAEEAGTGEYLLLCNPPSSLLRSPKAVASQVMAR